MIVNIILIGEESFLLKAPWSRRPNVNSLSDLIDMEKQKGDGLTSSIVMCSIKLSKDTGKPTTKKMVLRTCQAKILSIRLSNKRTLKFETGYQS